MASKQYTFEGITLEAGTPVEVARRGGHFWFSTLHLFSPSDLLCEVVLTADKAQGKWPASLFRSTNGGGSWKTALDIESYGPVSIAHSPQGLSLMPYELWPLNPGDKRNAVADGTLISIDRDNRLSAAPLPMRFLGFPRDLDDYHVKELTLLTNGNILSLKDGRLFATTYGKFVDEPKWNVFAVTSEDGGQTWRFLSIVATWKDVPDEPEGPDESNTARLPDGRLLCVYRVGSGKSHLFHKSYSSDEGQTWSRPARIEGAWSVEPQLVCLNNGLLLLSGGRPGLFLWACADGKGDRWVKLNLAEHHNALVRDAGLHYSAAFCGAEEAVKPAQSTSYTCMKALGPDEVLISYDRLGNGWQPAPGPWGETSAVFALRVRGVPAAT